MLSHVAHNSAFHEKTQEIWLKVSWASSMCRIMGVMVIWKLFSFVPKATCPISLNPILTVRRCFLRMYMMKPHILDVTPRKVRMPSKHCRVFSMLTSTQRPPKATQLQYSVDGTAFARCCWDIQKSQNPFLFFLGYSRQTSSCPKIKRPSKRVSTSLCTLVAQLTLK